MKAPAHFEIERKWIVAAVPEGLLGLARPQLQAYLAVSDDEEVRIKRRPVSARLQKGEAFEYFITCKRGTGIKRLEVECEISAKTFHELIWAADGRLVEKDRYIIDDAQGVPELCLRDKQYRIELDIYQGRHAGLIVAEVEFESVAEAESFVSPHWFGREVTDDEGFKNKNIARRGPINHQSPI